MFIPPVTFDVYRVFLHLKNMDGFLMEACDGGFRWLDLRGDEDEEQLGGFLWEKIGRKGFSDDGVSPVRGWRWWRFVDLRYSSQRMKKVVLLGCKGGIRLLVGL